MDQVAAVAAAVFPGMMQGDRPGSMPLLTEADNAPSKNCFRLVVLGSAKVGKTAIVSRFLHNKFTDVYTPTIEDFHRKIYRIRGEAYRLDILDTSGNDPFPAMRRLSLLTGDLFILVYAIDNRESFEEVRRLQEQVWESKQGHPGITKEKSLPGKKKKPLVPMVIVGNKCDRESDREVGTDELIALAEGAAGCGFVESSAKKNVSIEEIFVKLFCLGKLPTEMSPSMHRKVNPSYVPGKDSSDKNNGGSSGTGSPSGSFRKGVSIRRRLSDACGAVAPNARRPSIRTDLLTLQTQRSLHGGSLDETGRDRDNRCIVQ